MDDIDYYDQQGDHCQIDAPVLLQNKEFIRVYQEFGKTQNERYIEPIPVENDIDDEELEERLNCPLDLTGGEVSMLVSKKGVKWTWAPYSILPGSEGAPSVFVTWEELEAFK